MCFPSFPQLCGQLFAKASDPELGLAVLRARHALTNEEAEKRLQLDSDRSASMQQEAEQRLTLEAATKVIQLFATSDGHDAPSTQIAGGLLTLSSLGQHSLAILLTADLLGRKKIGGSTACEVIERALQQDSLLVGLVVSLIHRLEEGLHRLGRLSTSELSAQLSLEERLVAQAQAQAAPRVPGELAARRLGADLAQLRAALAGRTHDPREHHAPRGLRLDQAAAIWHVLSSARTVEIITGPAGTGKTWVLAAAARSALQSWRYSPFLLNGKPVAIQKQITFIFRLP